MGMPDLLKSLQQAAKQKARYDFKAAKQFVMPYGKFKGKALDEIATTDEGLLYLDYLRGEIDKGEVLDAISVYLDEPSIAQDLENALAMKEDD